MYCNYTDAILICFKNKTSCLALTEYALVYYKELLNYLPPSTDAFNLDIYLPLHSIYPLLRRLSSHSFMSNLINVAIDYLFHFT